jgi:hypothetical protein
MEVLIIISVIIGLAIILVVGNVLIYRWIVSRALRKFIRPHFMDLGYKVQNVEFVGLFKTGDFKRSGFPLRPFMHSGNPMQTTYVYVYLSKDVNHQVRITAKINTVFLFIKKVEYSALPKL